MLPENLEPSKTSSPSFHLERWKVYKTLYRLGFHLIPALLEKPKKPQGGYKEKRIQPLPTPEEFEQLMLFYWNRNLLLLTGVNRFAREFIVVEPDEQESEEYLAAHLPATPMMVRASEGRHHRYYRRPAWEPLWSPGEPAPQSGMPQWIKQELDHTIGGKLHKIDRKADGNYVVAPGSVHPSGHYYDWTEPWTEELLASVPVWSPDWLPVDAPSRSSTASGAGIDLGDLDAHQEWTEKLLTPLDERLDQARNYLKECPGTTEGEGASNACLRIVGKITMGFGIPAEEAEELLDEEWTYRDDQIGKNGLHAPWKRKEIRHKVRDSIRNSAGYPGTPGDKIARSEEEYQLRRNEERLAEIFDRQREEDQPTGGAPPELDPGDWKGQLIQEGVVITRDNITRTAHQYFTRCPCCNHTGVFTVDLKTLRRSYSCHGTNKGISWKDAINTNLVPPPRVEPLHLHRWSDLVRIADTQTDDWFWENWMEYGCLHMLTGRPFAGKSTVMMEMLAAVFQGKPWNGIELDQCPVVYFDFENRERKLRAQLQKCLGDDLGDIEDLFFRVPPKVVPRPLTPRFIQDVIRLVHKKIERAHSAKGLVVIDTFRSAFSATEGFEELSSSSMTRLMTPLKDMAMDTGWAVMILHHNKKTTDEFFGDNSIAGVLDYMWNWQMGEPNNGGKDIRTLSVQGRAEPQKPLRLWYSPATGRNILMDPGEDCRPGASLTELQHKLRILQTLSLSTTPLIRNQLIGSGTNESTLKHILPQMVAQNMVVQQGQGVKGNPHTYHLTDFGRALLGSSTTP